MMRTIPRWLTFRSGMRCLEEQVMITMLLGVPTITMEGINELERETG